VGGERRGRAWGLLTSGGGGASSCGRKVERGRGGPPGQFGQPTLGYRGGWANWSARPAHPWSERGERERLAGQPAQPAREGVQGISSKEGFKPKRK